ncbi:MAG: TetR/AcrR family transcriptional regulator [Thermodesulfobacteriota bacterium]
MREDSSKRHIRILKKTLKLAASKSFLSLKISDLAKASNISIGTFYSHFKNKEDLILSLAKSSWEGRLEVFTCLFSDEGLDVDSRYIGGIFCDYLFSFDYPALFEAEQLAATSAVWNAGSSGIKSEILDVHRKIKNQVSAGALKAIQSGEFKSNNDSKNQACLMDTGVWSLMMGSSYVTYAENIMGESNKHQIAIPAFLKENLKALCLGYGWLSKNPSDDIERIATHCSKNGHYNQLTGKNLI